MAELILDGVDEPVIDTTPKAENEIVAADLGAQIEQIKSEVEALTPEEQKTVDEFAEKIDLHNSALISRYGETARKKATGFADDALKGVSGKDGGEIGKLLIRSLMDSVEVVCDDDKKIITMTKTKK